MKIIGDYRLFKPNEFLSEYYAFLGEENKALLRFHHEFYSHIPQQKSMLEIGGGPCIYQLISVSRKVGSIVFSDLLKVNRDEIEKWVNGAAGAYNWDQYFKYVLKLEGQMLTAKNLQSIKKRVQKKIQTIIACDIRRNFPLGINHKQTFDIVSSSFCLNEISDKEQDFLKYLERAISLIRSEGYLVLVLVKNATYTKNGDQYFVNFPVNETYMGKTLVRMGLKEISIKSIPNEFNQGYEGIIFITARSKDYNTPEVLMNPDYQPNNSLRCCDPYAMEK